MTELNGFIGKFIHKRRFKKMRNYLVDESVLRNVEKLDGDGYLNTPRLVDFRHEDGDIFVIQFRFTYSPYEDGDLYEIEVCLPDNEISLSEYFDSVLY